MTVIRLRPEGPADAPGVRQVVAAAFAGPGRPVPAEVGLVEALRASDAWLPELALVAEVDRSLVGYALLSRVWVEPGHFPALALGPVAVPPVQQRRGYGTDVVQAALDAATALGERLVVVLGDPAFYRRFGFRPAAEFGLTSPWSGLGGPWQALPLPVTGSDGVDPVPAGEAADPVPADGVDPVPAGEVVFPAPWSQV